MRSGAISRRVELWKKTVSRNTYGEMVSTWSKVKDLRSYTKRKNGRQTVNNDEVIDIDRVNIEIRHQHDIDELDRIKYNNKMYQIDFLDLDLSRRWMTCRCTRINE